MTTPPGSSFLIDLIAGFGELLAAAEIGLTWDVPGANIVAMAVPDRPHKLVTLTPYPLGDDPTLSSSRGGLQIRCRAPGDNPQAVLALDDAIADVLLGNYPLTLSTGVRIVALERTSSVSMGLDTGQRWQWSSNYRWRAHRPSPHRY